MSEVLSKGYIADELDGKPVNYVLDWCYRRQLAHIAIEGSGGLNDLERRAAGYRVQRVSSDGLSAAKRLGVLGCEVSGGPSSFNIPEVAEIIHKEVVGLHSSMKFIILDYAKSGAEPDWLPDAVTHERYLLNAAGKKQPIYDNNRNITGYETETVNCETTILYSRMIYAFWYDSLNFLCDKLNDKLSFNIIKLQRKRTPWGYDLDSYLKINF